MTRVVPRAEFLQRYAADVEADRQRAARRPAAEDAPIGAWIGPEPVGRLRDILLLAATMVAALPEFDHGWPVRGWDRASTLATLRDLTPGHDPR